MDRQYIAGYIIFLLLLLSLSMKAEVFVVSSQQEFDSAQNNATSGDSIVWPSGTFSDIYMEIDKDDLFITAASLGGTIFTGSSRVEIFSDRITFQGFQFLNGDVGTRDVINIRGSNVVVTQVNIRAYRSYKYLRVREESQYCEITYCNFENRLNLDDQNILSILVDDVQPGYHKIQFCSFKNFDGTGNDLGIEPIRIGVSTQADFISRSLVEYCYFTQCNGDGEIISSKATQNVYRFNTFENNPLAELVLRHGSEAIVYGNFFINGKGGVRVREGQDHYIYNNYFYELDDRTIYLQNEDSDPLDNINIAFNTIVSCAEVRLGGNGNDPPTNVTFANNIFSEPDDDLFEEATGAERWIGNLAYGDLGISRPANGLSGEDPQLVVNSEGFFGLAESSPAINAALTGFPFLPEFEGMEGIDVTVLFDLMGQNRPIPVEEKDLGANEYPHNVLIRPLATEDNTGPSYNTSTTTNVDRLFSLEKSLIKLHPNPVVDKLYITINTNVKLDVEIEVYNLIGERLMVIPRETYLSGNITFSKNVKDLPNGLYTMLLKVSNSNQGLVDTQALKFIKTD